jgi:hypothetical protein
VSEEKQGTGEPGQSDARSLDAPGLLEAAARLVDRALLQLAVTTAPCDGCGVALFLNKEEGQMAQRLGEIPEKLRNNAGRLRTARAAGAGEASPHFAVAQRRFHDRAIGHGHTHGHAAKGRQGGR